MVRGCGKTALLMDGAFVTKRFETENGHFPEVSDITQLAESLLAALPDSTIYRAFFYGANPFHGSKQTPLGGSLVDFAATRTARNNTRLLEQLETSEDFAVRRGEVVFEGWRLGRAADRALQRKRKKTVSHTDFVPELTQKGVDMRIGLDIAAVALKRLAHTVVLVTGDADMIPAMRFARREGLRVGLCTMGQPGIRRNLRAHADFMLDWKLGYPCGP